MYIAEKKKALNCSFLLRLLYLSAADEENGRLTLYGFLALADSLHLIEGVSLGSILGADEYGTPNGSNTRAASFVIRNLKIGKVIVQNLPAFVITKQTVPLLVGNSAFDCFGTDYPEVMNRVIAELKSK